MELGEPAASQIFLETMAVAAVVVQLKKRPPPREEPEVKVAVMVAAD
jgi:hypothetical protein